MIRFVNLFVLSVLMIWLSTTGCIGDNALKIEDSGIHSKAIEAEENTRGSLNEPGFSEAEIQGLEADISELL